MKKVRFTGYLAGAILLSLTYYWFVNKEQQTLPSYSLPYAVVEKVPYSIDKQLTADWYLPQKEGLRPVLVLVHGGG
ncbi:MAG: hypothetical protein NZ580_08170, partial [Bacteroidia bacterium]|nr:hypothetical protein [Bacteroidia bacterium]